MSKKTITITILIILVILGGLLLQDQNETPEETSPKAEEATPTTPPADKQIEIIAENLDIPWEIEFLPNGDLLVTERPGNLIRITDKKETIPIEGVAHRGEGGLLGLELDPDFEKNNWIYLYLTSRQGDSLINRVERYTLKENTLNKRKVIIDELPGAPYHDGGRIKFGPEGYLYITVGDATDENKAQSTSTYNGSILRVEKDGSVPEENPFDNAIYSYGHRNPQGLAWDSEGRLWATEHGRSGLKSGLDELNLIQKGGNYGWPEIEGDEAKEGMTKPKIHSGPNTTWAPAGASFHEGSIFFAGLRGSSLYEGKINKAGEVVDFKTHLKDEFGRLRVTTLGPKDNLYLSTSNTDGRGMPSPNDDKIIKIDSDLFFE